MTLGIGTVSDTKVGRPIFGRGDALQVVTSMSLHSRRRILALLGVLALTPWGVRAADAKGPTSGSVAGAASTAPERQQVLPPWTDGYLYIHHISTGRGNSAYIVMPDGATMLIDAGETDQAFIKSVAPLRARLRRASIMASAG
jgi:hypothetical protein